VFHGAIPKIEVALIFLDAVYMLHCTDCKVCAKTSTSLCADSVAKFCQCRYA